MTYIFRWNGKYFGFISGNNLFDANAKWLGWIEDEQIWRKNGELLGELYEDKYILKSTTIKPPEPKVPPIPPLPPEAPVIPEDIVGKDVDLENLEDALKTFDIIDDDDE